MERKLVPFNTHLSADAWTFMNSLRGELTEARASEVLTRIFKDVLGLENLAALVNRPIPGYVHAFEAGSREPALHPSTDGQAAIDAVKAVVATLPPPSREFFLHYLDPQRLVTRLESVVRHCGAHADCPGLAAPRSAQKASQTQPRCKGILKKTNLNKTKKGVNNAARQHARIKKGKASNPAIKFRAALAKSALTAARARTYRTCPAVEEPKALPAVKPPRPHIKVSLEGYKKHMEARCAVRAATTQAVVQIWSVPSAGVLKRSPPKGSRVLVTAVCPVSATVLGKRLAGRCHATYVRHGRPGARARMPAPEWEDSNGNQVYSY